MINGYLTNLGMEQQEIITQEYYSLLKDVTDAVKEGIKYIIISAKVHKVGYEKNCAVKVMDFKKAAELRDIETALVQELPRIEVLEDILSRLELKTKDNGR